MIADMGWYCTKKQSQHNKNKYTMGLLPFDPENSSQVQENLTCICQSPNDQCRAELGEAKQQPQLLNELFIDNENDENVPPSIHTAPATPVPKKLIPEYKQKDIQELLIIGAGPHALTLVLRLLEQDPDFLSEKDRHKQAQFQKQMRPFNHVNNHIRKLKRGPKAVYKKNIKKSCVSCKDCPPPLTQDDILHKTTIVDAHGTWMQTWNENFNTIGITKLRSLINAHADPYDHRSLEYYAEMMRRDEELIALPELTQRDDKFNGPYQTPSTSVFHDFHQLLIDAYGIRDAVEQGFLDSIIPVENFYQEGEPLFQVTIRRKDGTRETMWSKRVVSSMGPNFTSKDSILWDTFLRDHANVVPKESILRTHEIVPWLQRQKMSSLDESSSLKRILIVGGGITSAQLALLAVKSPWCNGVTLLQRSTSLKRQFDVKNEWMGKARGKLLDEFWSLDMKGRAQKLQEYRKGGSIPPETLEELYRIAGSQSVLEMREEVEIAHVEYSNGKLVVSFDDGSVPEEFDMIWESTGSQNHIKKYPALDVISSHLPLDEVNGLPCLAEDLSWSNSMTTTVGDDRSNEPLWKLQARKRFWCMGVLAGLQLGPDALNLVGARHGAVRIAKAVRQDFARMK